MSRLLPGTVWRSGQLVFERMRTIEHGPDGYPTGRQVMATVVHGPRGSLGALRCIFCGDWPESLPDLLDHFARHHGRVL